MLLPLVANAVAISIERILRVRVGALAVVLLEQFVSDFIEVVSFIIY